MAANCPETSDTCGKCSKDHRTGTCKYTDKSCFHCTNCDKTGHQTSDRDCKEYKSQARKIREKNPDQIYKFFPISYDTLTWVYRKEVGQDEIEAFEKGIRPPHIRCEASPPREEPLITFPPPPPLPQQNDTPRVLVADTPGPSQRPLTQARIDNFWSLPPHLL